MEDLSKLITALASLMWPIIAVLLVWMFRDALRKVAESALNRKFSIKMGGNELTMEEASEQHSIALTDLQAKVADLEKRLSAAPVPTLAAPTALAADTPPSAKRILWVDDEPRNNSYLVAVLEDRGARVDFAFSTEEALGKLNRAHYDIVLSDMARPEGQKAGIELTHRMRQLGMKQPVYIFCRAWAATHLRQAALDAGVNDITASGTTLLSVLPL